MLSESLLLPHMLRARGGGGVAGSLAWGVLVDGFRPDRFDIVGALLCLIGVAGSLAWGILVDGFRPDRFDIVGALLCLIGVAVIMYGPRAGT